MADKEYIEREALKNDFCNACSTHKRYRRTFDECRNKIDPDGNRCFKMRLIDNAPAADVVEVVRCRDCRYYTEDYSLYGETPYHRCDHPVQTWDVECYDQWLETNPDDFCSYGERKANENM